MPQVTQRKQRWRHDVLFNAAQIVAFPQVALAINQTSATVQARLLLPTTCKILRAYANVSGAPAGTCSVNIVAGTAAEGSTGTADTSDNGANAYPISTAAAGTILFASDQAVTMTADTPTQLDVTADNFDVVWKGLITLRTVTNGTAAGNLNVALLVFPYDTNPPQGSYGTITIGSTTGQGSFTPATAIP